MKPISSLALVLLLGVAVVPPCGPGYGTEARYPWLDLKTQQGAQQCQIYENARRQQEQQKQQYWQRQRLTPQPKGTRP